MNTGLISVVVPCYDEEEVITITIDELKDFAAEASDYQFEFIFVDDGSNDKTLEILKSAAATDDRVRVISFARNFGHQIAVTAGIDQSCGDAVVLIDADLQDPPSVVLEMIKEWENGADVVYGVRRQRPGERAFKMLTARAFYRILNSISEVPIPLDTGDFRLMSRAVVEVLKDMPEKHRFVRGMVAWIGFKQVALPYERQQRAAGVSKYPLRKMLKFAADGIISFSSRPLRLATNLGLTVSALALLGIIYALFLRIFTSVWIEGWTALFIAIVFFGGVQLLCIGIIGEYLGRIYTEIKGRPLYIIKENLGAKNEAGYDTESTEQTP